MHPGQHYYTAVKAGHTRVKPHPRTATASDRVDWYAGREAAAHAPFSRSRVETNWTVISQVCKFFPEHFAEMWGRPL